METRMKQNNMGSILVLLVFAVFAVSILLILLTGADIVQRLTERDQRSYHYRTTVQYITTRVRQADQAEMITVSKFADRDTLVLTEEIDGDLYNTLIYCHDGYLREMFCEAGVELSPEFGEQILPVEAFHIMDKGSFLQVELVLAEGTRETLIIQLRSGRGTIS